MSANYNILVNAIIVQAVDDYRRCQKKLKKKPEDVKARHEIDKIEEFFRSEWFEFLSDIDPEKIIKRLKEEGNEQTGTRPNKKLSHKEKPTKRVASRTNKTN